MEWKYFYASSEENWAEPANWTSAVVWRKQFEVKVKVQQVVTFVSCQTSLTAMSSLTSWVLTRTLCAAQQDVSWGNTSAPKWGSWLWLYQPQRCVLKVSQHAAGLTGHCGWSVMSKQFVSKTKLWVLTKRRKSLLFGLREVSLSLSAGDHASLSFLLLLFVFWRDDSEQRARLWFWTVLFFFYSGSIRGRAGCLHGNRNHFWKRKIVLIKSRNVWEGLNKCSYITYY